MGVTTIDLRTFYDHCRHIGVEKRVLGFKCYFVDRMGIAIGDGISVVTQNVKVTSDV